MKSNDASHDWAHICRFGPCLPVFLLTYRNSFRNFSGKQTRKFHASNNITRVRTLALNIAKLEGLGKDAEQIEIIELAALLHDIADWKSVLQ